MCCGGEWWGEACGLGLAEEGVVEGSIGFDFKLVGECEDFLEFWGWSLDFSGVELRELGVWFPVGEEVFVVEDFLLDEGAVFFGVMAF